MRRLVSKGEQERRDRIKQLVVGGILILIMFASVIGYAFQGGGESESSKIKYNGFEFVRKDNFWVVEGTFENFIFRYNPKETEEFETDDFVNFLVDYEGRPLYFYSEDKQAEREFYNNLYNSVQRIQYACPGGNDSVDLECGADLPIKTCEDNFILIKEGEFRIEQRDNCLFIQGEKENLTRISDEVLFKILGIKQ